MKHIVALRLRLVLVAVLLAMLVVPVSAQESDSQPAEMIQDAGWIVQLKPGWAQFNSWSGVGGALGDSQLEALANVPRTYFADFAGDTKAFDAVARLANHPAVEYVEPNIIYEYQQEFIPNDTHFQHQQWANTVNLPDAWPITAGRSDLVVAIVDSGIRSDHPDLQGKIVPGWNFIDQNADTNDTIGHGTGVAGIVAATGNNGVGIAGTAMNAQLMPVKVGTDVGAPVHRIADGIYFAVENGADIINLSLGSEQPSATLENAIRHAYENNVVVVAAAGNTANKVSFPGTYHETISVGASTLDGQHVAGFTSRVSRTDLVAPGIDVVSTYWTSQQGNGYAWLRGTSFATPIVSGTVALMLSANPHLTVEEIRATLTGTARMSFESDSAGGGAGLLDAQAAVQQVVIPSYGGTWLPADEPVMNHHVQRTWLWGPHAFDIRAESYQQSELGLRLVAYYDKARMEITDVYSDRGSEWYVTNGLLVNELITGQMQVGEEQFEQRSPAQVPVAGDPDDPSSATYASFLGVLDEPPLDQGALVTQTIARDGSVGTNPALGDHGVTAEEFIPETGHRIASVFWNYLNSTGTLRLDHAYVDGRIFSPTFFATGFPITNPYWAEVSVGGVRQDVLIQCFERRCLTYTPSNPAEWQTEMGNVGQHYYRWRYGAEPGPAFTPDPSAYAMDFLR